MFCEQSIPGGRGVESYTVHSTLRQLSLAGRLGTSVVAYCGVDVSTAHQGGKAFADNVVAALPSDDSIFGLRCKSMGSPRDHTINLTWQSLLPMVLLLLSTREEATVPNTTPFPASLTASPNFHTYLPTLT